MRGNATDTDTDIEHDRDRIEEAIDGGFTIRYQAGPKAGLDIHFFTAVSNDLLAPIFLDLLPRCSQR